MDEFLRVQPGAEPPPEEQPGDGRVLGWGKILGLPANGDKISGSGVTGKGFGNGRDQVRTPHQVLTGGNYLQEVLNILDTLAGEKQATEMREDRSKGAVRGHSEGRGEH